MIDPRGRSKEAIISKTKYLPYRTILVNAKTLILLDKISIFAFRKILLSEDTYLEMMPY